MQIQCQSFVSEQATLKIIHIHVVHEKMENQVTRFIISLNLQATKSNYTGVDDTLYMKCTCGRI